MDTKREEIMVYIRESKILKSDVNKVYSLVFDNCTNGVQIFLKAKDM